LALSVDVTLPESVKGLTGRVTAKFGGIDILVNNAYSGILKPFEEMTCEDFESATRGALTSTFLCSQAVSGVMKLQDRGVIINLASIYALVSPDQRIYGKSGLNSPCNYGPAKAGVIQLTRWLATYLGPHGIRVNCISPGGFHRDQFRNKPDYEEVFVHNYCDRVPLGRMGKRGDLYGALVYLASQASEYVTGHNLIVDGGWTAW
jgi:NAD(P)-dependent dehydrogenase (short-subunit alcohol dehydrogenase family)